MERYFLLTALLTTQTTTNIPMDEISQAATLIEKHGLPTIMCAVLIIMTLMLFIWLLRRTNRDETIVKLLVDLTTTVNNIKNSDVDVAGSFDKHNTRFVLEIENVKTAIKDVQHKLDDIDHDGASDLKKILATLDQECAEISDSVAAINRDLKDFRAEVAREIHSITKNN